MKKHLRSWLINSLSLTLLAELFPGFQIMERLKGIALAGLGLTIADLIIKPILKTVFLPINLLTLGTLRWLINAVNLALLVFFIKQISVKSFLFEGIEFQGIIIKSFEVPWLLSLLVASILLTLIKKLILKVIRETTDE